MNVFFSVLPCTVVILYTILGCGEFSDELRTIPSIEACCLISNTSAYIFKPHGLPMADCLEPCSIALLYETRLFSIGLSYHNVI